MKIKHVFKNKKVIALVLAVGTLILLLVTPSKDTSIPTISYQTISQKGESVMRATFVYNGKIYTGRREVFKSTAYTSAPDEGGPTAYNGERLREGHIAADLRVLPLGTKVYIPKLNKIYTVVDTGSAIKGNKIDIWMKTKQQMKQWGIQDIEIIILD